MGLKYFPYICLAVVLFSVIQFGLDLTHHTHNTWLFNKMIVENNFMIKDPYLLRGEQITFSYGIITYTLGGILWFLFSYNTVDAFTIITVIICFIIIRRLIKDPIKSGFIILSCLFNTMGDSLVAQVSITLFWVGVYMFYKKIRFWQLSILLACLNHPFAIIPAVYFILKDKRVINVITASLLYSLIISYYFVQTADLTFYLPLIFLIRTIICLLPVLVVDDVFKVFNQSITRLSKKVGRLKNDNLKLISKDLETKSKKQINSLKRFLNFKISVMEVLILSVSLIITTVMITQIVMMDSGLFYPRSVESVKDSFFYTFPEINGVMRVVDYLWLPSLILNSDNLTLTDGSFRENNYIQIGDNSMSWTIESYSEFLNNNLFDYVLVCKLCSIPNNEREVLEKISVLYWENEYYYLYKIRV